MRFERITQGRVAARFAALCAAISRRMPGGLGRVLAPSAVGFVLINSTTFGLDLLILTGARDGLGLPLPVAITLGYGIAFAVSFLLNRVLNFRSRAPIGPQTVLYALAVAINYGAILLGVGGGLAALGVQYQVARLVAGLCEGVFMYCALRWVVFRDRRGPAAAG